MVRGPRPPARRDCTPRTVGAASRVALAACACMVKAKCGVAGPAAGEIPGDEREGVVKRYAFYHFQPPLHGIGPGRARRVPVRHPAVRRLSVGAAPAAALRRAACEAATSTATPEGTRDPSGCAHTRRSAHGTHGERVPETRTGPTRSRRVTDRQRTCIHITRAATARQNSDMWARASTTMARAKKNEPRCICALPQVTDERVAGLDPPCTSRHQHPRARRLMA